MKPILLVLLRFLLETGHAGHSLAGFYICDSSVPIERVADFDERRRAPPAVKILGIEWRWNGHSIEANGHCMCCDDMVGDVIVRAAEEVL